MFHKKEDGLGGLFLPFHIPAVVMAVICTVWSGIRGLLIVPMLIGSWLGWFFAIFIVYVICLFIISLTVDMKVDLPEKDHPHMRGMVIYVMGFLCQFSRVRIHMEGQELIPDERFYLVSNHRSNYDPIVTPWAFRKWDLTFIMKKDMIHMPIVGPWVFQSYFLPIDRDDPRKALTTIRNATELLKRDVVSIGVYPEGTRTFDSEMLPFHNGVFKVPQRAGVPIVVVSIQGSDDIPKNMPWRHTDVYLRVCAVIPAEEVRKSRSADLSDKVRSILEESLARGYPGKDRQ